MIRWYPPQARVAHILVVAFCLLGAAGVARGQTLPPGPQVLSYRSDIDETDQPYAIYIPPNFDETRSYPLVISLHGAQSNHRLNLRRVFGHSNARGETGPEASRSFPEWEDRV